MKYKLEELCEFITDGTHQTPEYCEEGGVMFLSSKDVTDRKIDWDNVKRIPESLHEKLYARLSPRKDDILLAKNGTTGVAALVDRDEVFDVYVSLAVLRPKDIVYPRYLLYAINSPVVKRQFDSGLKGVGVPNLHLSVIRKTEINIEKYEKQLEICGILDKVSAIIDARKLELQKIDELIKSRFVEMFGDVRNETKYPGIPLKELCSTISGGTPSTKFPEYYEGDIPWISTVSLGPNHIDGSTAKGYITEEAIANSATKLIPAGNILFGTRVGVGKSSLNDVDICTNQDIVAIVDIDETKYNRLFIKYVLDSYQPHFDSIKKGATILGITGDDLKKSLIPQVPISLQNDFEMFVNHIDKLKFKVQQSLDEAQMLFDSLMQKYFG